MLAGKSRFGPTNAKRLGPWASATVGRRLSMCAPEPVHEHGGKPTASRQRQRDWGAKYQEVGTLGEVLTVGRVRWAGREPDDGGERDREQSR